MGCQRSPKHTDRFADSPTAAATASARKASPAVKAAMVTVRTHMPTRMQIHTHTHTQGHYGLGGKDASSTCLPTGADDVHGMLG
jgi:hypothetical protein